MPWPIYGGHAEDVREFSFKSLSDKGAADAQHAAAACSPHVHRLTGQCFAAGLQQQHKDAACALLSALGSRGRNSAAGEGDGDGVKAQLRVRPWEMVNPNLNVSCAPRVNAT